MDIVYVEDRIIAHTAIRLSSAPYPDEMLLEKENNR